MRSNECVGQSLQGLMALLLLATATAAAAQEPGDAPWEKIGTDDGLTIYRKKVAGDPVFAYKGEGVLDAPIGKIVTISRDVARHPEWVNRMEVAKVLREITPYDRIVYLKIRSPWPVTDRDFVIEGKLVVDRDKKTAVFDIKSVLDPLAPPDPCCVRGEMHSNHVELKAIEGNKTAISAEAHVDPRGSVPTWIVNLVQKTFPRKSVEGLLKQVKKPDIEDFFTATP